MAFALLDRLQVAAISTTALRPIKDSTNDPLSRVFMEVIEVFLSGNLLEPQRQQ
jgi:hypothetical protein